MRANGAFGEKIAQRDAVIPVQEEPEHEQEGDRLGNHRRLGRAGRSATPHHDEQVIEHHVHKPGEHLHARGEGDHALVADQRRAARDEHLERRAEGDDLQVADRLRKRFALASQHPAQLLGEQGIQRQDGDRSHHEHEQGDADDALRALLSLIHI